MADAGHCLHMSVGAIVFGGFGLLVGARLDFGQRAPVRRRPLAVAHAVAAVQACGTLWRPP